MSDIIKRIEEVIEFTGLSQRAFGQRINFSSATINNYILRKRTMVDSELLTKIISTFDEVNSEWLLTGTGNMINGNCSTVRDDVVEYENKNDDKEFLLRQQATLISQQNKMIDMLQKQIEQIKEESFKNRTAQQDENADCADVSGW